MNARSSLQSVALAISTFRSDDAVLAMIGRIRPHDQSPFGAVIIVDSLGGSRIPDALAEWPWPIHYVNAERNLGSAGNLDRRLRIAADLGLNWCFAVNHDGMLDLDQISVLLSHAESEPRIGAAYPQLVFERAMGKLDRPRVSFHSYGLFKNASLPAADAPTEVVWSSSNGALYNLDAIRSGINAWPELWMGYEDMAIGWQMRQRGWKQLLCPDVRLLDNYEYSPVSFFGRKVYLAQKPSWYSYYHVRNLILIAKKSGGRAATVSGTLFRVALDVFLILAFREQKRLRLTLTLRGLIDGLRGRTGKGPLP